MRITTWNVNGIRAREAQLGEWIAREQPDVLCLQEVKASPEQVPASLSALPGYWCYWHGHKGYSGVALHLRKEAFPARPEFFHPSFDAETRIVAARAGGLLFASVYVPNGGKDFPAKIRFLEAMATFVEEARRDGTRLVLCGDLNIARTPRDVHPKLQKADMIGQTEGERALLERIIGAGLVDTGRALHPDDDQLFTWWAPWRNQRERNIGWRLDYVLLSDALASVCTSCTSHREFGTSDHAPVDAVVEWVLERGQPEPEPAPVAPTPPPQGQLKLL